MSFKAVCVTKMIEATSLLTLFGYSQMFSKSAMYWLCCKPSGRRGCVYTHEALGKIFLEQCFAWLWRKRKSGSGSQNAEAPNILRKEALYHYLTLIFFLFEVLRSCGWLKNVTKTYSKGGIQTHVAW